MNNEQLTIELRRKIIGAVGKNGGHLASNLGSVELTVALHNVYDTSKDRVVFDVGHQSYAHKIITGRDLSDLRTLGGAAGFPKPSESAHDAAVAGHASSSISTALGMARAAKLTGGDYDCVAVIGDGSLTGGMAYEALEDAGASKLPLVVVLNDNGMSITKNVGGMSSHLAQLRNRQSYFNLKELYYRIMRHLPRGLDKFMRRLKFTVKSAFLPSSMFESMGFRYLGPVDGHNVETLTRVLKYARNRRRPVLVHVRTVKGKGCDFAEREPSKYHGVSGFAPDGTLFGAGGRDFSSAAGAKILSLAERDCRVVAVTAAMGDAVGLEEFSQKFPERFFDVGIAEEHAVTMAAGMAKQGLKPVAAIYSTFLQRAFDQIIQDVAIESLPVVFAIDRAGLVGRDGETHHGVFDAAYLNIIPNITVFSPASFAELDACFDAAVALNSPAAVRYPRGGEGEFFSGCSLEPVVLREGSDLTLITYGVIVNNALKGVEISGKSVRVVKLCRISPPDLDSITPFLLGRVLVVEEGVSRGGVGERIAALLLSRGFSPKIKLLNTGDGFVTHGSNAELERLCGIDPEGIAAAIREICDG